MFVNLDEDQDKQVRLYYRMTKNEKIPGYLISRARSCRLPEQIKLLEEDIKVALPTLKMLNIDPFQRILGGKKVNEQSDVGPIIDELKRMTKEYEIAIVVNHHSNKARDRDKESTSSWLSGSNDLDAAWDFCLCLEYEKDSECMRIRNFQKEKAVTNIYYEAEIINGDEIVGLYLVPEELGSNKQARILLNHIKTTQDMAVQYTLKKLGMSERTYYHYLQKYTTIKDAVAVRTQLIENKGLIHCK
jgi:RecA-family ATPase